MLHKYDKQPSIPTVSARDEVRRVIHNDVADFLRAGGRIDVVPYGVMTEKVEVSAESEYKRNTRIAIAVQKDKKEAKRRQKPVDEPLYRSPQDVIAERRAQAKIRVTQPCKRINKETGSQCGAIRYNKHGDCLDCKLRSQKARNASKLSA